MRIRPFQKRPSFPLQSVLGAAATVLLAGSLFSCESIGDAGGGAGREGEAVPARAVAPPLEVADARRVLAAVREPGAEAVLVNVWATWCVPCREEFPDLMRVYREHREEGLRLVLVSADFEDQAEQARAFLSEQGVDFHTYHKTGDDMEFIDGLDPRWSGALPVTLIYDGEGRQVGFREGKASYETLKREVAAALEG